MLNSAAQIGADAEQRMLRFVAESEEFHRSVAPQLHWYLVLLGVDPPRQGGGIGSALLAPVLARADEGKLPSIWRPLIQAISPSTKSGVSQSAQKRHSQMVAQLCGTW